jgi:rubrerythrin
MRAFDSLTEKEILALAISQEEEDAHIYDDFAEGLKESYPAQAEKFTQMRQEEDGHRHRLIELYRSRFGEHIPLIRRQDVRGFVRRKPVWLVRPLGLQAVQKAAEVMELETKRFYEVAARRSGDAGMRIFSLSVPNSRSRLALGGEGAIVAGKVQIREPL